MDFGYNAPGVLLWWADIGDGHWHIAREWKFQQETAEAVGKGWHERNALWGIKPVAVVADPSIWAKTGHGKGESIAETLARYRLPMQRGDNDRKLGWQQCHEKLRLAPDGFPWVTVDVACKYLARTIPAQLSDKHDADDIDTNGDDHACFVAGTRVLTGDGEQPIETVLAGQVVWTRDGWRRVLVSGQTGVSGRLVTLAFSNGRTLTGTGNHPVWVEGRGFVSLDTVRYGDIMASCLTSLTPDVTPVSSGGGYTAVFRSTTTSTTLTGTPATTRSRIWRACQLSTIFRNMGRVGSQIQSIWRAFSQWRARGTALTPAVSGTGRTPGRADSAVKFHSSDGARLALTGSWPAPGIIDFAAINASPRGDGCKGSIWWTTPASSAGPSVGSIATIRPKPAPVLAPTVVGVCSDPVAPRPVYNLTVEDTPEYYAEGVLVHNCDAFRYGCMSRYVTKRTGKTPKPMKPWTLGWLKQQADTPKALMSR